MSFEVDNKLAFEIPLSDVAQSTTGKNEVSLEFHQNDEAPVSLMEMRFFVPHSNDGEVDTVKVIVCLSMSDKLVCGITRVRNRVTSRSCMW